MTSRLDGTGICDRCGADLPNTGVGYAVTVSGMASDGDAQVLHLCTFGQRCAAAVLTAVGIPVSWWDNPAMPSEPDPAP